MSFRFPAYWWGLPGEQERPPKLSLVHLLRERVLPAPTAALLWALLARRASLMMVGGYLRGVGKTTTLSALAACLPPATELVFTRGPREHFEFLGRSKPEDTYILVNEFSDHTPQYLWGKGAARVFRLTEEGYAFAGTMHAESPEELFAELQQPPVALPPAAVARSLQLLVMQVAFRASPGERTEVRRRVSAVYWVHPTERGPGGLGLKSLVIWDPRDDRWLQFSSPETWAELAAWSGSEAEAFRRELASREQALEDLLDRGVADFDQVRENLASFSAQRVAR